MLDNWDFVLTGTAVQIKAAVIAMSAHPIPVENRLPSRLVEFLITALDETVVAPLQIVQLASQRRQSKPSNEISEAHSIRLINTLA